MIFETEEHRAKERTVAETLEEAWECSLLPMPRLSVADYIAHREKGLWLVEVKTRNVASDTYPTIYLSKTKASELRTAAFMLRLRPVWVVSFTDGIWWKDLLDKGWDDFKVAPAGRTDREGAVHDWEQMIHVPLNAMSRLIHD